MGFEDSSLMKQVSQNRIGHENSTLLSCKTILDQYPAVRGGITLTSPTKEEQAYELKIKSLTNDLLHELDSRGFLKKESEWDKAAFGQMIEITKRFNGHMETAAALTKAFESKNAEISKALIDLGVGFRSDNVATSWLYDVLSTFVENSEMLKNQFLLVLRMDGKIFRPRMMLGQLFGVQGAVVVNCTTNGPKFAAEINIDLRNAFSHGLYWLTRDSAGNLCDLVYTKELGENETHLPVGKISEVVGKQNILTCCVSDVLSDWATRGRFK